MLQHSAASSDSVGYASWQLELGAGVVEGCRHQQHHGAAQQAAKVPMARENKFKKQQSTHSTQR